MLIYLLRLFSVFYMHNSLAYASVIVFIIYLNAESERMSESGHIIYRPCKCEILLLKTGIVLFWHESFCKPTEISKVTTKYSVWLSINVGVQYSHITFTKQLVIPWVWKENFNDSNFRCSIRYSIFHDTSYREEGGWYNLEQMYSRKTLLRKLPHLHNILSDTWSCFVQQHNYDWLILCDTLCI